jgi:hypothetical protein
MVKRWWWREKRGDKSFSFYLREISESWYQVPGCSRVARKIIIFWEPQGGESDTRVCNWYQVPGMQLVPGTTGTWYQYPTLREFFSFSYPKISFSLSLFHFAIDSNIIIVYFSTNKINSLTLHYPIIPFFLNPQLFFLSLNIITIILMIIK